MKRLKIEKIIMPFIALFLGLIVSLILISISGVSLRKALAVLLSMGFGFKGKVWPIFMTLGASTPLILTGLSAMLGFKVGVFCIAQEGQYVFGAITAAFLGSSLNLPSFIGVPLIIVASMIIGALYGSIPAILKVKLGVNEIISSIMLNNTAALVLEYLVAFPMRADSGQKAQSAVINKDYWLFQFIYGSRWGLSFVIALVLIIFFYFYLNKTYRGYEIKMVGENINFANYGGIESKKVIIRTLIIAGSISGLAGSLEVLGNYHRVMTGFSSGLGFDGLSVAMLGLSHPIGVFIVAVLLAGIRQGAQLGLQISLQIPRELGAVLIALVILFIALQDIYRPFVLKIINKISAAFNKEEK